MYFGASGVANSNAGSAAASIPRASDTDLHQDAAPALSAKVARLTPDMKQFAEKPHDVVILGDGRKALTGGEHDKRFFEASWMFKRGQQYYFTYSTGDTHFLAYATGEIPMDRSTIAAISCCPSRAGPRITRSSRRTVAGGYSMRTPSSPTKTTCATSR